MSHRSKPRDLVEVARIIELRERAAREPSALGQAITLGNKGATILAASKRGVPDRPVESAAGIGQFKVVAATVLCTVAIFSAGLLIGRKTTPPALARSPSRVLTPLVEAPLDIVPPPVIVMNITRMTLPEPPPPPEEPQPETPVDQPTPVVEETSEEAVAVESSAPVESRPRAAPVPFEAQRSSPIVPPAPVAERQLPFEAEESGSAAPTPHGGNRFFASETFVVEPPIGGRGVDPPAVAQRPELAAAGRPAAPMNEERAEARILALCARGRVTEARAEAERLLLEVPRAALSQPLRASCAFTAGGASSPVRLRVRR